MTLFSIFEPVNTYDVAQLIISIMRPLIEQKSLEYKK